MSERLFDVADCHVMTVRSQVSNSPNAVKAIPHALLAETLSKPLQVARKGLVFLSRLSDFLAQDRRRGFAKASDGICGLRMEARQI
jgi:hypothetical protein